jgi:lysophospholipase L1-like esterase
MERLTDPDCNSNWAATWSTSVQGPFTRNAGTLFGAADLKGVTVRQFVRIGVGGDYLRVRFSNAFGSEALSLDSAYVALRQASVRITPGSERELTFAGSQSASVAPGETITSDAVALHIPDRATLAISIYSRLAMGTTGHLLALQTAYVSEPGDYCGALTFPIQRRMQSSIHITGIEVLRPGARAVVAFGDCLADGAYTTPDACARWIDILNGRLLAAGMPIPVLNAGISGNRLLHDGVPPFSSLYGVRGLDRFERDVLDQRGAGWVILAVGGADFVHPGVSAPLSEEVGLEEVAAGIEVLVQRARRRGLRVVGCTLGPPPAAVEIAPGGVFPPEKEEKRRGFNEWVLSSGAFDAVIDIDQILRGEGDTPRLNPIYASGRHGHLNDAGHKALGEAIDLALFTNCEHPLARETQKEAIGE